MGTHFSPNRRGKKGLQKKSEFRPQEATLSPNRCARSSKAAARLSKKTSPPPPFLLLFPAGENLTPATWTEVEEEEGRRSKRSSLDPDLLLPLPAAG